MSISHETLRIEDVILRKREDTGEEFPAAIISGISFQTSSTGNASFSKRRVSLPLNGMKLSEAKMLFPPGKILEGYELVQYRTAEPFKWTTPDGTVRFDQHRFTLIRKGDPIPHQVPANQVAMNGESSTRESVSAESSANGGSLESDIFEDSTRKNDLQPQD